MWIVAGTTLQMAEEDFGVVLPVKINGATLGNQDSIKFVFKTGVNGETLLEKEFHGIVNNTVSLVLTQGDSEKLPIGSYVYRMDWYQDGAFMCNVIPQGIFRVVDKA